MPDPTPNPFPLTIPEKINSPALLAYFQQFGIESYLSAEEINQIVQALKWLQENGGSGGGSVDTSALLTKLSMQEVNFTSGGSNQVISLSAALGAGTFRLTNNSLVSLAGFSSGDATLIYNGRILVIFNDTANPVTLIQNSGAAALKYSSVANLVMPSKGIALFKIGADTTKLYLVGKSWEDAPQIDFATQAENEQAATATDINTINNTKATTPRGLRWFWNALRGIAWSWSGKQSFFGGVNMGSLTASRWLRLNVDKDIESFDGQALLDGKVDKDIIPYTATADFNPLPAWRGQVVEIDLDGVNRTMTINASVFNAIIIKGSGVLTVLSGAGRTLVQQNNSNQIFENGTTALIFSMGTTDYLSIKDLAIIDPQDYALNEFNNPATNPFMRFNNFLPQRGFVTGNSIATTFIVTLEPYVDVEYDIDFTLINNDNRVWATAISSAGFTINTANVMNSSQSVRWKTKKIS